jgi:REP element-mobilizing transposase RayT
VHLLVQVWAQKAISMIVQILKRQTIKKLQEEFPGMKGFFQGDSFWAEIFSPNTMDSR